MQLTAMESFERFLTKYHVTQPAAITESWPGPVGAIGWNDLLDRFAGATFNDGLYRIHDRRSAAAAHSAVVAMKPEFADRLACFGFDWLGREFAVDIERTTGKEQVLLIEPGTGQTLQIPGSFATFHNQILVDFPDAALAEPFWTEWSIAHPETVPLAHDVCVGYRVPLFLGGEDTVDNLEVTDRDVYWTISAQLVAQLRDAPSGTRVDRVDTA